MSVTLGALVIAISTEFSVLLSERYRAERALGHDPRTALRAHVSLDRRRGARLRRDGDRRLRGARRLRHPDAARLRLRDGDRPDRLAARRAARAARRAAARRAPRVPRSRRATARSASSPSARARAAAGPAAPARRRRRAVAGHRYAWLLGIAAILAVAARHDPLRAPDAPRATGVPAGERCRRSPSCSRPPTSSATTRATPATPTSSAQPPGQPPGLRGARPILNVCELTERGPLVLGLIASRGASCLAPLDRLGRVAAPPSRAAGRARRDRRRPRGRCARSSASAAGAFRSAGTATGSWPALYGVVACPYVTVARWRGRVQGTLVGAAAASGGELERLAVAAARGVAGWRRALRAGTSPRRAHVPSIRPSPPAVPAGARSSSRPSWSRASRFPTRNLLQRDVPHRRWLVSSSAIVMLAASHGHVRMTSPTVTAPTPTLRLSSARARRTSFAR